MSRGARGIETGPELTGSAARVLSREALDFLDALAQSLSPAAPQGDWKPGLPAQTSAIRAAGWKAALPPRDLQDLRTAVLSPLARGMLLGALNSGARLCLADLRGPAAWRWDELMTGHANLMDRWTSAMEHVDAATGKRVSLSQRLASLMLRVRPLAEEDPRVKSWGKPLPAGLFDAGLYLFHTARTALAKASGPYLCLTGVCSRGEARRWNDLLVSAQSLLGLPAGTVRVMVEADTPRALWEIDEILHELREHATAVASGGYRIAAQIARPGLAGRAARIADPVALEAAVAPHLVRAAHRRGIHALSAMTGAEPKAEAQRAVKWGCDGLMLAAAEQVAPAARLFNEGMPTANQLFVGQEEAPALAEDLENGPELPASEALFRRAIAMALQYCEATLSGTAQPLPEAGEAEFLTLAAWHWTRRGIRLDSGNKAGEALYEDCLFTILKELKAALGEEHYHQRRYREAVVLLRGMILAKEVPPSFTILAMKKKH